MPGVCWCTVMPAPAQDTALPERIKPQMVSQTRAFTRDQVRQLMQKITRQYRDLAALETVLKIMENVYLHQAVLSADRYADQALYANRILNKLMFTGGQIPEVITIETDWIAAAC